LEIYRYLPPPLLEGFDPENADVEELLSYLAKARFAQELEEDILVRAIGKALSD